MKKEKIPKFIIMYNNNELYYNKLSDFCRNSNINYCALRNNYYKNNLPYNGITKITRGIKRQ